MFTPIFIKNKYQGAKRLRLLLILVAVLTVLLSACSGTSGAGSPVDLPGSAATHAPGTVSFSKDVLPVFQSRCINCHGGEKTEKGLNMTSYDKLMAGSEKGPVVIAGDPVNSKLIQMIQQGKMPKRGPKLLPDQLQILTDWVKAGALNN
jgi:predicted small secreted protein